jgi:hypothetical protein
MKPRQRILQLKTLKEFRSEILKEDSSPSKSMDPPNMLVMKRKSIRQFPNNQRVALYYVDKINKYVTVPYTAMQWSSTAPTSSPTEEL